MSAGDSGGEPMRALDIVIIYEFDHHAAAEQLKRDLSTEVAVRSVSLDPGAVGRAVVAFDSSNLRDLVRVNRYIDDAHEPVSSRFTPSRRTRDESV